MEFRLYLCCSECSRVWLGKNLCELCSPSPAVTGICASVLSCCRTLLTAEHLSSCVQNDSKLKWERSLALQSEPRTGSRVCLRLASKLYKILALRVCGACCHSWGAAVGKGQGTLCRTEEDANIEAQPVWPNSSPW